MNPCHRTAYDLFLRRLIFFQKQTLLVYAWLVTSPLGIVFSLGSIVISSRCSPAVHLCCDEQSVLVASQMACQISCDSSLSTIPADIFQECLSYLPVADLANVRVAFNTQDGALDSMPLQSLVGTFRPSELCFKDIWKRRLEALEAADNLIARVIYQIRKQQPDSEQASQLADDVLTRAYLIHQEHLSDWPPQCFLHYQFALLDLAILHIRSGKYKEAGKIIDDNLWKFCLACDVQVPEEMAERFMMWVCKHFVEDLRLQRCQPEMLQSVIKGMCQAVRELSLIYA